MKLIRKAVSILTRSSRRAMRLFFHFDAWHLSTWYEKPYARDIVRHLNGRPAAGRGSVIEIGCGLGDILRRLRFVHRTGYDKEPAVLDAARFLARFGRGPAIDFQQFEFPGTPLKGGSDGIVMVNWIHHVAPDMLRRKIGEYFGGHLLPGGEIIIDTVQDQSYKYNHDIAYLTAGIAATVTRIGEYHRQRETWSIKKMQ